MYHISFIKKFYHRKTQKQKSIELNQILGLAVLLLLALKV